MTKTVYVYAGAIVLLSGLLLDLSVVKHPPGSTPVVTNQSAPVAGVDWQNNGANGRYFVEVIQGSVSATTSGVIKTDTDCTADSQGLSHCHNIIALDNQTQITVINTHNMNRHRCLNPNEKVTVEAVNARWVNVIVHTP